MAEVTVNMDETPSAQLVAEAKKRATVTDKTGREIVLEKPSVLMQMRFIKAMGEAASNQAYMSIATPVTCVREIDGLPVSFPTSEREFEALLQRLDEAGMEAVMTGFVENFGAANVEEEKIAVKK
jgi:predicted ATPase